MNSCGEPTNFCSSEQSHRPSGCLCVAPLGSSMAWRDRHGPGGLPPNQRQLGPCPANRIFVPDVTGPGLNKPGLFRAGWCETNCNQNASLIVGSARRPTNLT